MRNILLTFCLVLLSLSPTFATTKEQMKTTIASVKQTDNSVAFTITANMKFHMGGNRYILHIGDKQFFRHTQSGINGKGQLVFYIPSADFDQLNEGAKIFLTYGGKGESEEEMEDMSKHNSNTNWSLGTFNKALLSK